MVKKCKDKILTLMFEADDGSIIYTLEKDRGLWNPDIVREQMQRGYFEGFSERGKYMFYACGGVRAVQIGRMSDEDFITEKENEVEVDDEQDPLYG